MNKLSQTVSFVALSLVLILAGCGGGGGGSSATNSGTGTGGTTPLTGTTGTPTTGTLPVASPPVGGGVNCNTSSVTYNCTQTYNDFYYLQDAGGAIASTTSQVIWTDATHYNVTYFNGVGSPITTGVVSTWSNTSTLGLPYSSQSFQSNVDVIIGQVCTGTLGNLTSTNILVENTRTTTITSASSLQGLTFTALYDCNTQPSPSYNSLIISATGALTVSTLTSTPTINITATAADFTSMLSGKWLKVNPTPTTTVYYSFNAFSFVDTGGATHYAIVMRGVPNLTGNTTGNAPNAFVSLWYK
jgi:hypothetical protein